MRSEPIHRINLKGPWNYEWLDGPHGSGDAAESTSSDDSPLLADSRIRMPASWQSAFGNVSGTIRFRRRFQRPTNLDENERVHIAFDGIGGEASIAVNDQPIGSLSDTAETSSFDVTELLLPSNELSVELTHSPGDASTLGGLYKPVALEIHRARPE
jgi:beta-galactosidase/beta-glucuronidase